MTITSINPPEPSEPGFRRLGLGTLVILCVISLCSAMALSELVERRVVAPACKAYAAERGELFKAVDVYSLRQEQPGAHCLFTQADGSESAVWLQRVVPFSTDFWTSLVMDIEISTPVLWVMSWLLWNAVRRLWASSCRQPMRRQTD
jgi:hypothetical protein